MTEYRFPKDGWVLVEQKRAWVPEWMYRLYSLLPPWLEPFRWMFNKRLDK